MDVAPTLMVVEDHRLLADNLASAFRDRGFAVEIADDLTVDGILALAERTRPGVVLLDVELGTAVPAPQIVSPLRDQGVQVVMVTGVTDPIAKAECIEAGAVGVVHKSVGFARLVDAVEQTLARGSAFRAGEREELLASADAARANTDARLEPFRTLTGRERVVLQLLVRGLHAEAIAQASYVSLATVRSQIRSVLMKLGVNSQLAAAAMAREAGWSADAA